MNKWIYPAILVAGLIVGIIVGFVLSNILVVKPLTSSYSKQIDRKDELIVTLVKVPKNLIQNTLTVRKVKRGSSVYYVPSSDLKAVEIKMDSLLQKEAFTSEILKGEVPDSTQENSVLKWFLGLFKK